MWTWRMPLKSPDARNRKRWFRSLKRRRPQLQRSAGTDVKSFGMLFKAVICKGSTSCSAWSWKSFRVQTTSCNKGLLRSQNGSLRCNGRSLWSHRLTAIPMFCHDTYKLVDLLSFQRLEAEWERHFNMMVRERSCYPAFNRATSLEKWNLAEMEAVDLCDNSWNSVDPDGDVLGELSLTPRIFREKRSELMLSYSPTLQLTSFFARINRKRQVGVSEFALIQPEIESLSFTSGHTLQLKVQISGPESIPWVSMCLVSEHLQTDAGDITPTGSRSQSPSARSSHSRLIVLIIYIPLVLVVCAALSRQLKLQDTFPSRLRWFVLGFRLQTRLTFQFADRKSA